MTLKGWWPALSPDGRFLAVTRLDEGRPRIEVYARDSTRLLGEIPAGRTAQAFWLDADTVACRQAGRLRCYRCPNLQVVATWPAAAGESLDVADGHWAVWRRRTRRVRYDGRLLRGRWGGAARVAGDWLGHLEAPDSDKPGQTYMLSRRHGERVEAHAVTLAARPFDVSLTSDPALAYGGHGGPVRVWADGSDTECSATPWPREAIVRLLPVGDELWLATVTTRPDTRRGLLLVRPVGDRACLQVDTVLPAIRADVRVVGQACVWAIEDETHAVTTGEMPISAGRSLVAPATPRRVCCGYFFGRYVDCAPYGPDHPSCPGSHTVITPTNTTDEKGALSRAELANDRIVLGAGLIPFATRWDLVDAVFVHVETTDVSQVDVEADRARELMRSRGLAGKPVLAYTGRSIHWGAAVDAVGLQAYMELGETAAAFLGRVAQQLDEAVRQGRRVTLTWSGYDRRPLALDRTELDQAQAGRVLLCDRYRDSIAALLIFSDGRAGGTRAYPHWYPHHEAAFAALQGAS